MVVFFDIDGTLLDTGGAGGAALVHAFAQVYGISEQEVPEIALAGAVDSGLFADLQSKLQKSIGVTASVADLTQAYLAKLEENLSSATYVPRLYPGARELVDHCVTHPGITSTLITGNFREGARAKLEYFGLWSAFDLEAGGFGDDAEIRDDVARCGVRRAVASTHVQGHPQDWWLLGDTPRDVQCARAAGVQVAAVATGGASHQELADAEPDLLFEDLSDLDAVVNAMGLR